MPGMTGLASLIIVDTKMYCAIYGVEVPFALAVAHVESRTTHQEFRVGLMGKRYYGPFGINRSFLSRWPVDELKTNIEVGVRALRGKSTRAVLKRYNASFNEAYYQAVMAETARFRRELE